MQLRLLLLPGELRLDAVFQNRIPGGEVIGLLFEPLDVAKVDADLQKVAFDPTPINFFSQSFFREFAAEFLQVLFWDLIFQNQL